MSFNGALRASRKHFTCLEAAFSLSVLPTAGFQDCLEVEPTDLCLCDCFKLHCNRLLATGQWYRNELQFPEAQSPVTNNGLEKGSLRKPGFIFNALEKEKVRSTANLHLLLLKGAHGRVGKPRSEVVVFCF